MDELLLSMARRAIEVCKIYNAPYICPVQEGDLKAVVDGRPSVDDPEVVMTYLIKLPESYALWHAVSRAIVELHGTSFQGGPPTRVWALWRSHVYDLGRRVMEDILNAWNAIGDLDDRNPRGINNITDRLRQVDELLSILPGDLKDSLSDNLQDTL